MLWVQNSESKKEEFRKYLERAGVIDALTKGAPPFARRCGARGRVACVALLTRVWCGRAVLVALYETSEKPANALECAPSPSACSAGRG